MKRGPKGEMRPRHHKAAKALANGAKFREAAAAAGLKGNRASKGVTIAEWLRKPAFQALVAKYTEEAMSGPEWEAINAQVARMERPARIVTDGDGNVEQVIYDQDRAMERQGRALGKYKDFPGGGGAPLVVEHRFADMTEEELRARLQKKLDEAGVRAGDE